MTYEEYDELGKEKVRELFDQLDTPYEFTTYKYDKLDVYFGNSSAGEIKYRTTYYSSFLIQEDKVKALASSACANPCYIVVLEKDIYFWNLNTIYNYLPQERLLPDAKGTRWKKVRFLPTKAANLHFVYEKDRWSLTDYK